MPVIDYLTPEVMKEAGVSWDELKAIKDNFKKRVPNYEQAAQAITNVLLKAAGVHSVRYRVKDPTHLIEKVVRKRHADKTRNITVENYEQQISDLAGVRVLHLFKKDWQRVHRFITEEFTQHETPTAYFRDGDSEDFLDMFRKKGCNVKKHQAGYRSVHYIVETALTKKKVLVEIQVRTIFEEGWSEVDHKLRYPNFSNDPLTNNLLLILNRLAGSADEMSSFVQDLRFHLVSARHEVEHLRRDHEEKVKEMQQVIDNLNLSAQDKSKLQGAAESLGNDFKFHLTLSQPSASWMDALNQYIKQLELRGDVFDPFAGTSGLLDLMKLRGDEQNASDGDEDEGEDEDGEPVIQRP